MNKLIFTLFTLLAITSCGKKQEDSKNNPQTSFAEIKLESTRFDLSALEEVGIIIGIIGENNNGSFFSVGSTKAAVNCEDNEVSLVDKIDELYTFSEDITGADEDVRISLGNYEVSKTTMLELLDLAITELESSEVDECPKEILATGDL